jgi:hypothetical protein
MKLVGRVPVEPLNDERMTNIERGIVAGAAEAAARGSARVPRPYLGFAAAAMVGVAVGVIGWKLLASAPVASPIVAEAAPIEVHTDAQRSTLDLGDATIQSDPLTAFVVTRPEGGVLVDLARGKVELQVGKRGSRPPLVVRAGDTDVIVVGTHFTVDYGDGTGEVDVRVTEGVVKIVRHHEQLRVAAGSAFRTPRGVIRIADAGPALSATIAASHEPAGGGTAAGGTVALADPPPAGSGSIEIPLGDGPDVLHDRTAHVPGPHVPPQQHAGAGSGTGTERTQDGAGSGATPHGIEHAGAPATDLKSQIAAQAVEPASDVGEPNAQIAIGKYRDIVAHTTGDEASRAFYSIAVLQAMKLGRTGDALQTLDLYLRRFTGGKEYAAALWLRVRILCLRDLDERCRQAAYSYVHQAPGSDAAHLAELITISE